MWVPLEARVVSPSGGTGHRRGGLSFCDSGRDPIASSGQGAPHSFSLSKPNKREPINGVEDLNLFCIPTR
ncbi:hypothetical protein NL676_022238 [Syzygium grande]|nr:hypothetical protein NL676_022238 [Syzygium grande]